MKHVSNLCFVISGIQSRLNNRRKFNSHGLLEMVLEVLWRTETSMKLLFLATQLPSSAASVREITLSGFSEEDIKEALQMWKAPEASDEEVSRILSEQKDTPLHCDS